MRKRLLTTQVIIHSSASSNPEQDNVDAVRTLHTAPKDLEIKWGRYDTHGKNFSDIGYHFFISKIPSKIHLGREISLIGAGVSGHNEDSVHICLSGDGYFTNAQFENLRDCLMSLYMVYPQLDDGCVIGHCDLNGHKLCPQFDVTKFLKTY